MAKSPRSRCGRCGRIFKKSEAKPGSTTLCGACLMPHQLLSRADDGRWRCGYCGQDGTMAHLHGSACTHRYARCGGCGGTPYCTPECPLMANMIERARPIGF